MRSRFVIPRRPACVQRAPVVRRHRERIAVARRRAGPPQGATALQRRLRLRHLPAVFHQPPERSEVITEAREAVAAAQRATSTCTHRPARHEPVRRDDGNQCALGLSAAGLRNISRSASRAAPCPGELDFAFRGDRRHSHELWRPGRRLGRIVLDNSRYYLLGYYSDSSRWSRNRL